MTKPSVSTPRVAVVIVSYNTRDLTLRAVSSVLGAQGVEPDVWVVDNASTDGSPDEVRLRFPEVHLLESEVNLGFGRGNNLAFESVEAPYVLLLNSDAAFQEEGGLLRLVQALEADPFRGVVAPRLQAPSGELEYSARAFPGAIWEVVRGLGLHRCLPGDVRERRLGGEFRDHERSGPTDWVTGACMLVRRDVVERTGGFDPRIFLYGEEMEWCWRIRQAGWEILFEPGVTVVHHRGASSGEQSAARLRLAMAGDAYVVRKHRGWPYLCIFFLARCTGLAAAAALQGGAGLITRNQLRRRRGVEALRQLAGWVAAVAKGGAVQPGAVVTFAASRATGL